MRFFDVFSQISVITAMLRKLLPTLLAFLVVYVFLLMTFTLPTYVLASPVKQDVDADDHLHFYKPHTNTETFWDGLKLAIKVIYNRFWNLAQFNLDGSRSEVEGVCWNGFDQAEQRPLTAVENCNDLRHAEFNFVAVALYMFYVVIIHIVWMNTLIAM